MADKGFAIRCPHCAKWNQWTEIDPKTVAVERAEFDEILTGLRQASEDGKPWDYTHPKLIRCTRPRWSCLSSFEAIVFSSWEEMKTCLREVPEEWPYRRDFRLYRANCRDRWEDRYWAIMFCTPPFTRMRDIEFENLMDRELLSRLIAGMSVEINSVLTIFGANIFEPLGEKPKVFWMPIEAYSPEERLTPPRFNKLCERIRHIEMEKLVEEFKSKKISVNNCPIKFGMSGKCADKEKPACMREPEPDWCHCPAFMKEREKRSLCYSSDLSLIDKVAKSNPGEAMECGIKHSCPAKFKEYGFPIMVHDHLVAVVMIGQMFSDSEQIAEVDEIITKCKLLEGSEGDLEKAKQDLIREESELREKKERQFYMKADEVQRRIDLLRPNIERITEMANARYRDIRRRSEAVFREELLEYFQKQKSEPDFFGRAVLHILKRMREFWAFKAVYLVAYSHTSKDIRIMGMSLISKGEKPFSLAGKKVGRADPIYRQTHPIRYLYRRSNMQEGLDPLIKDLLRVFDEVSQKDEFFVEGGDARDANHLFVLVPFYDEVYAFIFSVRDAKGLCRLERPSRGDVSELCQEIMLRLCTEVVHEFGDVKSFVELREQALKGQHVIQVAAVAAQLVHTLGNRVGTIPVVVKDIKRLLLERDFSDRRVLERFVDLEADADAVMNTAEQLRLRDYTKQVMPLDISAVVEEALRGAQIENTYPETTVSVSIPEGLAPITGIKASLFDTFVNLLQNAARANAKQVRIEAFDHSKSVELIVSDDGDGISESDLDTIWLPNLTGRAPLKYGGFHIGLWASKLVIESMMHGSISVKSKLGKGTQFTIRLLKFAEIKV